ncbi:MAG TPA: proton-conducting transporter membrane subunit, partial [Verrucomicrobiae bacterium]|nr:proton-conducting transporter membrane subunit [Verrucomicrobiae bacterium]
VSGAVLQMFSHGVIAGLLFAVVGRMVYDRTHTRKLEELRLMPLYKLLPFAALVFVIAGLASMGMPGFSGFPAELSILIGAWKTLPLWAAVAALGILVAAAFTLRAIHVAFFGQSNTVRGVDTPPTKRTAVQTLPPITMPERIGAILLIAAAVLIGLKPDLLLNWIIPSLHSPLMTAGFGGVR